MRFGATMVAGINKEHLIRQPPKQSINMSDDDKEASLKRGRPEEEEDPADEDEVAGKISIAS